MRPLFDGFGAPVSHHNQGDVDVYSEAATLMLGYAPDPAGMISEMLKSAPDFIMGHCFLAGIHLAASDKRRQADLRAQYEVLKPLMPQANTRERGHFRAIELWLDGALYAASQVYADILLDCPRDLSALQFGHQIDFLLGQASSNRDRPARVAGHWSGSDPAYSFVLGMQAFGLEEAGHYPQAEDMALRCVALNPKDTWGIHALAHCYEMQGKTAQGIAFMRDCEDRWGGDNYMSVHNRWHLLLYHLEQCDFDLALGEHDRFVQVTSRSEMMDAHDSAAMLWRLGICGVDVGDRWQVVADHYAKFIDQAYLPFNDMHAMMAFVATGRDTQAEALIEALEHAARGDTLGAMILNIAGLPIVRAMRAFGQGDHELSKTLLSGVRHSAHLVGGSVAQRDVLNLTLLGSAARSGDTAMVRGLVAERSALKPQSPLTDLFLRQA